MREPSLPPSPLPVAFGASASTSAPITAGVPRLTRRQALRLGGAFVVGGGLLTTTALTGCGAGITGAESGPSTTAAISPAADAPVDTAKVVRRDLAETASFDGTLGYGTTSGLSAPAGRAGTVTRAPVLGAVIDRGGEVWRIDGEPTVLFLGDTPLWRELSTASSDNADIAVAKRNLQALGHFDGLLFTDDDTFDAATALAVRRWQASLGVTETGTIALGAAVVAPAAVRVASVDAGVGSPAQGKVLTVTGTLQVVSVELDASKRSQLPVGEEVKVKLPGATFVAAKVTDVGRVATSDSGDNNSPGGGDTTPKVAITITLADGTAKSDLDETPVKVQAVTASAKGVLAVPVGALVALREGGLAVERVGKGYVAVTAGMYADGFVEVTGSIAEGDEVVTTR